jgi:hypothetical protein
VRDYKFNEAANVNREYQRLLESLKTKNLAEAVTAFTDNIERVICLASFPIDLIDLAGAFARIEAEAFMRISGKSLLFAEELRENAELLERFKQESDRLFKEWATKEFSDSSFVAKSHMRAAAQLKGLLGLYPPVATGAEAIMSSFLVGTWTAFETLAGDLWVSSVNVQPEHLAGLTGTADRIEKRVHEKPKVVPHDSQKDDKSTSDEDDGTCEPLSQKQVTVGIMCKITRGKYDLADKMGQLLAEAKRVQFVALESIRESYSLAFSEKVKRYRPERIDAALANTALDALSAVRNLIVHRAGVADDEYVGNQWCLPASLQLKNKDKLLLDGGKCQTLVSPVIGICVELIQAVDSWLTFTRR